MKYLFSVISLAVFLVSPFAFADNQCQIPSNGNYVQSACDCIIQNAQTDCKKSSPYPAECAPDKLHVVMLDSKFPASFFCSHSAYPTQCETSITYYRAVQCKLN